MRKNSDRLEEYVEKVLKGEVKLHELDLVLGNSNLAALVRRLFLEKKFGVSLSAIASTIIDFEEAVGRNIENPIGAVQVPLGIIGPLLVKGDYAKGEYYVPLATTEGALVASVNRGAYTVTLSGGARVKVLFNGMTRAPLFKVESIDEAVRLVEWVKEHFMELKRVAESTTRYGRLVDVEPYILGNNVWLRLVFTTGDAMGMNMVTIASTKICEYIEKEYPGKTVCVAVSGNMCVDKKPSLINALRGRGKTVVAEAVIPEEIALKVLKTSVEDIHEVNLRKNWLGSSRAGSISYNAHYANIVAAIFLATGQDIAQVVESSIGYTWTEVRSKNNSRSLYITVTMPSLEVGTVGGGTRLPTQREALSILGVAGGGEKPGINALKLAEIIAATVLAGELSLLAALASNDLAKAHIRLGGKGEVKE